MLQSERIGTPCSATFTLAELGNEPPAKIYHGITARVVARGLFREFGGPNERGSRPPSVPAQRAGVPAFRPLARHTSRPTTPTLMEAPLRVDPAKLVRGPDN